MTWQVLQGDCFDVLRTLEAGSVQTCVTSPPYWGLRDYGTAEWEGGDSECDHAPLVAPRELRPAAGLTGGKATVDAGTIQRGDCRCGAKRIDSQLGLEPTPEQYVENLVRVFREVRRVLRDDGTVWLNLGDSYNGNGQPQPQSQEKLPPSLASGPKAGHGELFTAARRGKVRVRNLKPKDLVGIPWRVAFALQADGWWLRSDIIWAKPNPMPESVTDRPTRSHEYIFLLSKSARYFYDADAIREANAEGSSGWLKSETQVQVHGNGETSQVPQGVQRVGSLDAGRNKRSVWTVTTQPYSEAHFATFPPKLIEPCILAGSPPKCCGECGAPWERMTESRPAHPEAIYERGAMPSDKRAAKGTPQRSGATHGGALSVIVKTLGWRPTCDHADSVCPTCGNDPPRYFNEQYCPDPWHKSETIEPVVLDPFCGSGTTGLVALRHNRSFIGIELSETYAEMARNRIRDDAPLLNGEEAYSGPVVVADKQSAIGEQQALIGGDRSSGFNERWKNRGVP